ncbi:MAG: NAD(P)-binding domain-containing protein [Thermoleophilaceae bacterium]|nr:NAD(P)-binding domain-containing protein [Thermoleophilaceae bacterium]
MGSVCVIGAGSSGIAACQVLAARGIPFDCFEKGSQVGGNWRYMNDNGMSSAYRSLHINTSRRMMEYASYPMPEDYPDYPSHWQIARYFDDFVDHFGLRERITFNTEVTSVEPAAEGGFDVTTDDGQTRRYDAVMVANGHHWDPRWPFFPGEFDGEVMHAHDYKTPEGFEGKDVVVLGFGNSAVDIACELGRVARNTYLATRRGAYVLPKYLRGKPLDELTPAFLTRLPVRLGMRLLERELRRVQGKMTEYGLPEPDHRLGEAHPTLSSELLPAIGHGRVKPKPSIQRLEGDSVRFADGSVEHVDRIVYCTGYKISFPFLDSELIDTSNNEVRLYRHVVHPDVPGLYFIGLVQPLGAIMPIAERQSEWIADVLEGKAALPSVERMRAEIERYRRKMAKRYVRSPRHTIQVDFHPYMRELARERRRGRRRRPKPAPIARPQEVRTPA